MDYSKDEDLKELKDELKPLMEKYPNYMITVHPISDKKILIALQRFLESISI